MNQVVIKVIGNYSYQTSKCLGQGVYGKVYEGIQRESKEKVAIKKIDLATFTNDKYLQNAIFSQIYLLKRFNHNNIVKFKDVLSSKNSLYIITQFCKNGDLKQLMKRRKFKQQEVFQIMRQLLSGFTELIRQKIIHRDLKPANILINQGTYKIGDFGFAKYVDNFGSQMLKSCVGSPIYMAPQILQRSLYTTKCDIWSLGVICYEMLMGYPPWKARDQNELLRNIKQIPISHILKKISLNQRSCDFLKKTLAYSQDQRIGWSQLFDMFNPKSPQKPQVQIIQTQNHSHSNSAKQRGSRLVSQGSTSTFSQQQISTPQSTSQSRTNSYNSIPSIPMKTQSPQKKTFNTANQQIQNAALMRQFCIYYHFYLVELLTQINYIKSISNQSQLVLRLLYVLSMLIKYKSTYCISVMSIHYKNSKNVEEAYRKMKLEHQTYQFIYSDLVLRLQKQGVLKKMKVQITQVIGYGDIVNEQKTQKIQNLMIKYAHEVAQMFSDQVRKRAKTLRDFSLVQILQNVVDILSLGIGKVKVLRELRDQTRADQKNLQNYVGKVIGKLDRITSVL